MKRINKFNKILAILFVTTSCISSSGNVFAMKNKNISNEKWIQLFDTSFISEEELNKVIDKSEKDLNNKISRNKKGNFIDQIDGELCLVTPDGSRNYNLVDVEDIWKKEIDAVYDYFENRKIDKYKVLYEILSKKQNVCQTRASILLKHLKDIKKGIYVPIHIPEHVLVVVLDQNLYIRGIDYSCGFESFRFSNDRMNFILLSRPIQIENYNNELVSFGIWFLTLQRYLNENANEETRAKFQQNSVLHFNKALPFSFLPIIELPTYCDNKGFHNFKDKYNGKEVVPVLLLSQDDNSLIPGCEQSNKDLINPTSYKESNYSVENLNYIINLCIIGGKILSSGDKSGFGDFLMDFLKKILDKFPGSKILYLNKEYYDKKRLDYEYVDLVLRGASDWIKKPVDGTFVLLAEPLKEYMKKEYMVK